MEEKDIKNLLDLYFKGECTPDEKQYLESMFDELSIHGEFDEKTIDTEAVMHRLKGKIDRQIRQGRFIRLSVMLRVAAAVFLISSVAVFFVYKRTQIDAVKYVITTVPKGQKMKLTLSDGSTVMLNAGSRIRYPEKFNSETRSVTLLDGEAFFDIKHNDEKPFVVETPGTQTQVLGTAFNVQAYQELKEVKVTVLRGKVAVKETGEHKPVLLLPDEQAIVNTATGYQSKKHINANESIGWVQGKFIFRNETLMNVALILQNSYNVKIEFKKETTKEIRFTANFNSTDSLEKILFAIAKANGITYSVKDNIVRF
ncbi:FecR family protein [Chitinophaga sp. YR573]|uniref:FecR family protein n=1 Tax=Chitinophaga sp. YR573 TaxID=1881040 RepID=UPI0008BFCE94|nr:FecR domain-containing protein [Chitinophaga sp. YR573]SEW35995.1 FecR family protein [Chitinophaga sp. YR573]